MTDATGHMDRPYIKTHMYYPEYHVNAELEWLQIRKQLSKILLDNGLKVTVVDPGAPPPA